MWSRLFTIDGALLLLRQCEHNQDGHWDHREESVRIQMRRSNGRWRKATLQDLGVPREMVTDSELTCSKCGKKWWPIIKQDPCFDCKDMTTGRGRG